MVGFLNGASPGELGARVVAFRDSLAEKGYVEGHSVAIEYRWGLGQYERLPEMAVDLVRQRVSVIAATGGGREVENRLPVLPTVWNARGCAHDTHALSKRAGEIIATSIMQKRGRKRTRASTTNVR
jgi:hypothetical protein